MSKDSDWETQLPERRCTHCNGESPGTLYPAGDYLRGLQRLRENEAMRLARMVEPFFWSDADMLNVRLCDECAARLRIERAEAEPISTITRQENMARSNRVVIHGS